MPDEVAWVSMIAGGWEAYQKSFSMGKEHLVDALSLFREAEALLREVGDHENLPLALDGKGAVLHAMGNVRDLRLAAECYDEETTLLKSHGNQIEMMQAISSHQAVLRDLALLEPEGAFARIKKGLKMGEEAIDIAASLRDERALAWASQTTADLCVVLSRLDSPCSRSHLSVALDLYRGAGELWDRVRGGAVGLGIREAREGRALSLLGMAEALVMLGQDLDSAEDFIKEANDIYLPLGTNSYQMGHVKSLFGSLYLAKGDKAAAARHFREARETFSRLGFAAKASQR